MIRHEKDGWYLYSKDGKKKLGGPYKTEGEAKQREAEVNYFKHKTKEQGGGADDVLEEAGSQVQSFLFDKKRFSVEQARAWLKKHGKKAPAADSGGEYHRFRQAPPGKYKRFNTIDISAGIKAVIGVS